MAELSVPECQGLNPRVGAHRRLIVLSTPGSRDDMRTPAAPVATTANTLSGREAMAFLRGRSTNTSGNNSCNVRAAFAARD